MKHWLILFALSMLLVIGACASMDPGGCSQSDAKTEDLLPIQRMAAHLSFPEFGIAGSALNLGGKKIHTCRHCLPDYVLDEDFRRIKTVTVGGKVFQDLPTFPGRLNGEPVTLRLIAVGATTAPEDDWATLEVVEESFTGVIPKLNLNHQFKEGEVIYLIGYWHAATEQKLSTIKARVSSPPLPWLSVPSEIICVAAPHEEVYEGISGGVAAVWNEETHEYVAVGIYRGKREWSGLVKLGVHAVRRFTSDQSLD